VYVLAVPPLLLPEPAAALERRAHQAPLATCRGRPDVLARPPGRRARRLGRALAGPGEITLAPRRRVPPRPAGVRPPPTRLARPFHVAREVRVAFAAGGPVANVRTHPAPGYQARARDRRRAAGLPRVPDPEARRAAGDPAEGLARRGGVPADGPRAAAPAARPGAT